jgi:hypothetical protein
VFYKVDPDKPVELGESDTGYLLTGTAEQYFISGGCCVGSARSLEHIQGPFVAHIDPVTFAPTSVQYESGWAYVDNTDPASRAEILITVAIEVLTFNEPVTVSPPSPELVVEGIDPTATPTAVATHARGPVFVLPVLEDPSRFTVRPTPTPYPPGVPTPPVLPIALPPTSIETFLAEIAAAEPSDVFEVAPGLVVVYPPCSAALNEAGMLFAKLYDLGDPAGPQVSSSYVAVIAVWVADSIAAVDYPGHVTTAGIGGVADESGLMREIVRRADPALRCG